MTFIYQKGFIRVRDKEVRNKSGDLLGNIEYVPQWRCEAYNPEPGTIYSAGCLKDISKALELRRTTCHECGQKMPCPKHITPQKTNPTDPLEKLTFCTQCNKMTKSQRKDRCSFCCIICGHDKTLGDIYFAEAKK